MKESISQGYSCSYTSGSTLQITISVTSNSFTLIIAGSNYYNEIYFLFRFEAFGCVVARSDGQDCCKKESCSCTGNNTVPDISIRTTHWYVVVIVVVIFCLLLFVVVICCCLLLCYVVVVVVLLFILLFILLLYVDVCMLYIVSFFFAANPILDHLHYSSSRSQLSY